MNFVTIALIAQQSPASGVTSDVKYIRCATCEAAVNAAHKGFSAMREKSKKPASEEQAQQLIERICKPEEDEGAWLRAIDLVEQESIEGDRRLALVAMDTDGPCGQECQTVALACEAVLDGVENELGEALYAGGTGGAEALRKSACREWGTACRKGPPKLEPTRPDGPPFRPFTLEERSRREARGPPPPGVLAAEALRVRLGVGPSVEDAAGWGGGEALMSDEEATGRGEHAPASLEQAEAFEEI